MRERCFPFRRHDEGPSYAVFYCSCVCCGELLDNNDNNANNNMNNFHNHNTISIIILILMIIAQDVADPVAR